MPTRMVCLPGGERDAECEGPVEVDVAFAGSEGSQVDEHFGAAT